MQGYLKYFFHSPASLLPIPDVSNLQKHNHKSEYHLVGDGLAAENWVKTCRQDLMKQIAREEGTHLFWVTKCKNRFLPEYGDQYIVGFLEVEGALEREIPGKGKGPVWGTTILGRAHLFDFTDGVKIKDIYGFNLSRGHLSKYRKLDDSLTLELVDHFSSKENRYESCLQEVIRLDTGLDTCFSGCSLENLCKRK
ncbi:MAG: hypothetical protein KC535_03415 [Nanoarchaeota archaeon]|nr:hypothetical protein [Nanoarchaeota archaeon]